jgi:DNA-directed RNA polymerase subunit E'/Rpb7
MLLNASQFAKKIGKGDYIYNDVSTMHNAKFNNLLYFWFSHTKIITGGVDNNVYIGKAFAIYTYEGIIKVIPIKAINELPNKEQNDAKAAIDSQSKIVSLDGLIEVAVSGSLYSFDFICRNEIKGSVVSKEYNSHP